MRRTFKKIENELEIRTTTPYLITILFFIFKVVFVTICMIFMLVKKTFKSFANFQEPVSIYIF